MKCEGVLRGRVLGPPNLQFCYVQVFQHDPCAFTLLVVSAGASRVMS